MSGEHEDFARWLRERAALVGFDTAQRGMISRLAEAAGVDTGQMSRFLRGQATPAIEGQRGLAKALGVKLPEVMIRAGSAEPADFPDPAAPDLAALAERLGVPTAKQEIFVGLVEMIANLTRDPEADDALPHLAAIIGIVLKVAPQPRPPGISDSYRQTGASETDRPFPNAE